MNKDRRAALCASPEFRGWRIRPDACCRDVCASLASEKRRVEKPLSNNHLTLKTKGITRIGLGMSL